MSKNTSQASRTAPSWVQWVHEPNIQGAISGAWSMPASGLDSMANPLSLNVEGCVHNVMMMNDCWEFRPK